MSTAIFSAPAPAACWPACSAPFRSTPVRRAPASSRRPADARNCPACSRRRSCWRCSPSAPRCCATCPRPRSAACCCSWRCASSALRQIVTIYRQSLGEFLLIVATAAAIIVLPIEQGVAVGIGLSLLHGIWSTTRARLIEFEHVPGHHDLVAGQPAHRRASASPTSPWSDCRRRCHSSTPRISAPTCRTSSRPPTPKLLVLEASGIVEIDFTAAQMLLDLIGECRRQGVTFAVARLESTASAAGLRALWHLRRAAEEPHLPQRRRGRSPRWRQISLTARAAAADNPAARRRGSIWRGWRETVSAPS